MGRWLGVLVLALALLMDLRRFLVEQWVGPYGTPPAAVQLVAAGP